MLKKKIIASSVFNLTDARYFAGWMVDYIHLDMRTMNNPPLSLQTVGEMQSWVEGPEYILSIDNQNELEEGMVKTNSHYAMIFHNTEKYPWPTFYNLRQDELEKDIKILGQQKVIISELTDLKSLENLVNDYQIELYLDVNAIDDYYLDKDFITGYMVHGSPEEKVGFKSYDEIDSLFEQLEVFD